MGTLIERAWLLVGGLLFAFGFLAAAAEFIPIGEGKLWNARDGVYDEIVVLKTHFVELPLKPGQKILYRGPK